MDLQLAGKCALVTGSNRGTGSIIARGLAEEGAKVIVLGPEEATADDVVEDIRSSGGDAHAFSADILTDEGAASLHATLEAEGWSVDILVNNFGRANPARWDHPGTEDWVEAINLNLLTAVRMVKLFAPAMKVKGWGRIIQLGTIGSTRPNAQMPGYYAAKAGLAASTVSLAKELSGTGITVNGVNPGLIRTPEVEANFLSYAKRKGWGETWDEAEEKIVDRFMPNPSGRIPTREEVADVVVFLASPRAGQINGQNLRVDGGAVDIVS